MDGKFWKNYLTPEFLIQGSKISVPFFQFCAIILESRPFCGSIGVI